MPLMMLGPFIFAVPTFSFETLQQTVSARAEGQAVIGAAPPTHRLGPEADTITLSSTFYPHHLNGQGLAQLRGIQQATRAQVPMMMVGINGIVYGRFLITSVSNTQEQFFRGTAQAVTVDMELLEYVGPGGGGTSIAGFNLEIF